jgi:hypothetical protein
MIARFDFVLSYWIFAWFLLYYYKYVTYNPLLLLIVAGIENVVLLSLMIYYKNPLFTILLFIIINTFIKIIPIYLLRNTKVTLCDIKSYVVVFLIYLIWMYLNKKDPIEFQNKTLDSIKNKRFDAPITHIVNTIKKNLFK